jgi:hypothetical protein
LKAVGDGKSGTWSVDEMETSQGSRSGLSG